MCQLSILVFIALAATFQRFVSKVTTVLLLF